MSNRIHVVCFTDVEDANPAKVFEGQEYSSHKEADFHRVVINPNHSDPKKQMQLHVRDGARNPADPLRFARVEIYQNDSTDPEAPSRLVYRVTSAGVETKPIASANAKEPEAGVREVSQSKSPTFEEFTEAGYRPASYPPRGYDVVSSAGYDAYLANKEAIDAEWDKAHPDALNTQPVDETIAPLDGVDTTVENHDVDPVMK
jgi:hypothetical protein